MSRRTLFAVPYPAKTSAAELRGAALRLLETAGVEALTMRTLADALGVKAPSLYRHVTHRDALLALLSEDAASQMHAALAGAAALHTPGRPALEAVAYAFVAFAQERPELYALLHRPQEPGVGAGEGQQLWQFLLGLVSQVTGQPGDTASTVALWSFLHGYAQLERSGLFGLSGPAGGFERGLEALLA